MVPSMIRPVPIRLNKRITEIGGLAPNGSPLFRVLRGCDRTTFIGGRWKRFDANGNCIGERIGVEDVLKYPEAKERYVFEMWCPPENYGTEREWEEHFTQWIDGQYVETLGPFPRSGEYELVRVLETPTKRAFVPLTEAICDALVATAKLNKELPERIKREAAQRRREEAEKARVEKQVAMIDDMRRPKFARQPYIIVPSNKEISNYG